MPKTANRDTPESERVMEQGKANRKRNPAATLSALASASLIVLAGCGGGNGFGDVAVGCVAPGETALVGAAPDYADSRITLINDDTVLSGHVTCQDQAVAVVTPGNAKSGASGHDFSLKLVAEVAAPAVVGLPEFTGTGLDDLIAGGDYLGTGVSRFVIEIDAEAVPDTFRWSDDGGATWAAEAVAISTADQPLSNGVTIAFGDDTGHTLGDRWNVDAAVLQASSISIHGEQVVVSHNVAGAPRLGGIQVFHKVKHFPVLTSEALIRDEDIHAVTVSGGTETGSAVYAAGAARPGGLPDPAVLERFKLEGKRLVMDGYARTGLSSFAATSVTSAHAGTLYATSGSQGGVSVVQDAGLTVTAEQPLSHARWVTSDWSTVVVARGGEPGFGGTLTVYDVLGNGDLSEAAQWPFPGADVPEAKTTVEIIDDKAFIAAGPAGVQVLSLTTGDVLAALPVPLGTGADPADVVANSVTVDNDLMFISFGGAGVYVAQAGQHFKNCRSDEPLPLTLLGRLDLGDGASANHVAYKAGYLYVAGGFGGLKIIEVEKDS